MDEGQPVAIVGAGIAGLTAARLLSPHLPTILFEAAAVAGGRLATCRVGDHAFDHGAQFFKPRHPRFMSAVRQLEQQGLVAPWPARFVEVRGGAIATRRQWTAASGHYVGVAGMDAIVAGWSAGLDLRLGCPATGLRRTTEGTWLTLNDGSDQGPFGLVILALPAPAARHLLPADSVLRPYADAAVMRSCYALMVGLDDAIDPGFDAALVKDAPISWVSVTESRPGHHGPPGIVALAANAWADAKQGQPPADIQAALLNALSDLCGHPVRSRFAALHHWPHANSDPVRQDHPLIDTKSRIALCGDWVRQGRVEVAFLSGAQIADAVLAMSGCAGTSNHMAASEATRSI
ncbi:NAD(P)/FAD-dependent oxidoreductase [Niveispirillum cyanobacteriorum]|uniref:NAD(P)/FAD-dependent oxidoreductase n=1 Tax=Niveispirillum cyanobacteriorum TaxID=1612173 RepID=UPI00131A3929|nr:FAD-dependent oxidoreductase [Niveispirillum cyanobacteriorum]